MAAITGGTCSGLFAEGTFFIKVVIDAEEATGGRFSEIPAVSPAHSDANARDDIQKRSSKRLGVRLILIRLKRETHHRWK